MQTSIIIMMTGTKRETASWNGHTLSLHHDVRRASLHDWVNHPNRRDRHVVVIMTSYGVDCIANDSTTRTIHNDFGAIVLVGDDKDAESSSERKVPGKERPKEVRTERKVQETCSSIRS